MESPSLGSRLSPTHQLHTAKGPTALTLQRLAEALYVPRIPDKGRHLEYNHTVTPSSYVGDDILALRRTCRKEDFD